VERPTARKHVEVLTDLLDLAGPGSRAVAVRAAQDVAEPVVGRQSEHSVQHRPAQVGPDQQGPAAGLCERRTEPAHNRRFALPTHGTGNRQHAAAAWPVGQVDRLGKETVGLGFGRIACGAVHASVVRDSRNSSEERHPHQSTQLTIARDARGQQLPPDDGEHPDEENHDEREQCVARRAWAAGARGHGRRRKQLQVRARARLLRHDVGDLLLERGSQAVGTGRVSGQHLRCQ
jgi:hypothetical protein